MPTLTAGQIARMRRTVPDRLLAMRCTIQRLTGSTETPWGNPSQTWADHLKNVPCWWDANSGQARDLSIEGPDINAIVDTQRVVLRHGTDVLAGDRISEVIGLDNIRVAGPVDIVEVIRTAVETAVLVREVGPS